MVGVSDQVTNCDRGCAVEKIEGIDDKGQRYGEIKRDCVKVLGGSHAEGCYPTPDSVCRICRIRKNDRIFHFPRELLQSIPINRYAINRYENDNFPKKITSYR